MKKGKFDNVNQVSLTYITRYPIFLFRQMKLHY